jgi:hypothetical protein
MVSLNNNAAGAFSSSALPNGKTLPLRNIFFSQLVCDFPRLLFCQSHDRITQVLSGPLGVSVPHHPVAPSIKSDKEAGKI